MSERKKRTNDQFGVFFVIALLILGGIAVCSDSSPAMSKEEPYFKGKVIHYVVCTTPGGGSDAFARFLVRWWPRFIPGKPKGTLTSSSV